MGRTRSQEVSLVNIEKIAKGHRRQWVGVLFPLTHFLVGTLTYNSPA